MKSKYAILLFIFCLLFSCSKDKVEKTGKTSLSDEIEQIINMDISPVNPATVPDGEYTGQFPFRERLLYKVKVTVNSGKMTDIEVLENGTGNEYAQKALKVVPRMLEKQSPDVDVVTGATVTSKALMKCVEEALKEAK